MWHRNILCHLIKKYPVRLSDSFSGSIDFSPPWICLDKTPTWLDGANDTYLVMKQEPVLYRKFMKINKDATDEIIKFVHSFGLLGINPLSEYGLYVESVARWQYEISEMNGMLKLWEICRDENDFKLREYIIYSGGNRILTFTWRKEFYAKYPSETEKDQLCIGQDWSYEDLRKYILDYISIKTAGMVFERNTEKFNMSYEPLDLLSAMWAMLLFQEIVCQQDKKECAICKEPFIPKRTDQLYCSGKCKVQAHRQGLTNL